MPAKTTSASAKATPATTAARKGTASSARKSTATTAARKGTASTSARKSPAAKSTVSKSKASVQRASATKPAAPSVPLQRAAAVAPVASTMAPVAPPAHPQSGSQHTDPRYAYPQAGARYPQPQTWVNQPMHLPGTPFKLCPNCKSQAQTLDKKCPHCHKKYGKKNHTVLKVLGGLFIMVIALIVGMVLLLGAAANEVVKNLNAEQAKHAISSATYSKIKLGMSKGKVLKTARPATPENTQEFEDAGVLDATAIKSSCIYFNKQGGSFGDIYQFCFNGSKLTSKNNW